MMPAMRPNIPVVKSLCRVLRRGARPCLADTRGATAVEYGLIIALLVLAMLVGFVMLANRTTALWGSLDTRVANGR